MNVGTVLGLGNLLVAAAGLVIFWTALYVSMHVQFPDIWYLGSWWSLGILMIDVYV